MVAFSGKFVFPSFLLEYDVKMSWYWSPEQRDKQDSMLNRCPAGHVPTFLLAFLLSIISVPCVCGQRKRWSDFSSSKQQNPFEGWCRDLKDRRATFST